MCLIPFLTIYTITNIITFLAILDAYKNKHLQIKQLKFKFEDWTFLGKLIGYLTCGFGFLLAKYSILIHIKILKWKLK